MHDKLTKRNFSVCFLLAWIQLVGSQWLDKGTGSTKNNKARWVSPADMGYADRKENIR